MATRPFENLRRLGSCDAKGLLNGFRFAVDDQQIGAGRAFGSATPLLPMAQSVDVESEARGKLLLGHLEAAANGLYIELRGDVNFAVAFIGSALCIR